MKCPNCNADYKHPKDDTIWYNAINYGSQTFVVLCVKCKAKISVYAKKIVEVKTTYVKAAEDASLSWEIESL